MKGDRRRAKAGIYDYTKDCQFPKERIKRRVKRYWRKQRRLKENKFLLDEINNLLYNSKYLWARNETKYVWFDFWNNRDYVVKEPDFNIVLFFDEIVRVMSKESKFLGYGAKCRFSFEYLKNIYMGCRDITYKDIDTLLQYILYFTGDVVNLFDFHLGEIQGNRVVLKQKSYIMDRIGNNIDCDNIVIFITPTCLLREILEEKRKGFF